MKLRFLPLLFLSVWLSAPMARAQGSEQHERVTAACVLALGRLPSPDEIKAADTPDRPSVTSLYAKQSELLKSDDAARRAVATRACVDALGRDLTADELAASSGRPATYAHLMKQHLASLTADSAAFREAIDRAYRLVINRPAYDDEIAYWKSRGPLPYALLVGAIENWAQRNAPGLTVTGGTPSISINSRFVDTGRLSPAVANEARAVLGLPIWTDVARLNNPGCNIVAVGAAEIASVGGIHFLAFGAKR